MYLTPYQKRQLKIVLALVIGIPVTIFAMYQGIQYLSRASTEAVPKDVVVSNLTTNSLTVTWFTEISTDGYVVPLLNGVEQSPVQDKRGSGNRFSHYVELKSLEPSTTYSFVIVSNGKKYTGSDGSSYVFSTAPVGTDTPVPNPIHGSITGISGNDVIIYVLLKNKSTYPVSTTIPSGGNWIVDLSSFRKVDDKSMVRITNDTDLILMAKSKSGVGAILEGKYSALFDSNGKLNQTMSLVMEDSEDLITYFPEQSKLMAGNTEWVDDDSEMDPVPPGRGGSDSEQDYEIPPTDYSRQYVIRHDLRWVNLVSGDTQYDLTSGEGTLIVTNLTDVGFTVVWRSPDSVEGYIKYGKTKDSLNEEVWDIRDGLTSRNTYYSHSVETNRLDPDTTYYFEVYSGTQKYNNNGSMYSVRTLPTLGSPPPFETRSGTLRNSSTPGDWVIVAKIIDDDEMGTSGVSRYLSTMPDDNGNWILTVGDARSEDGSSYFSFSNSDILQIFLLGKKDKTFDFKMSVSDILLDSSTIASSAPTSTVKLLSDYGIVNIK